jgi:hypothetical protein
MEHLSLYGGSVREPGGRALIMRTVERHVTKVLENLTHVAR